MTEAKLVAGFPYLRDMEIVERTGVAPFEGGRWFYARSSYEVDPPGGSGDKAAALTRLAADIEAVWFAFNGLLAGENAGKQWRLVVLTGEWFKEMAVEDKNQPGRASVFIDAVFAFERK